MMGKLDGKVAVITGSSRGLGLAIGRAYAREGAAVVLSSRSAESIERAAVGLRAQGARAVGRQCDVGELAQVEALAAHALEVFGRYDIWVNNAAMAATYGPTMHVAPDSFVQAVRTNILGTYYGSLVALRHFLPRRTGKLINLLGRGDRQPVPMQNAYAASKAWSRNFTRALAKEYRDSGVGIFAFNPGMMLTDLITRVEVVEGHEALLKFLPVVLRMWARPPEIPAEKAVWLASASTDRRTGLEVRLLGGSAQALGVMREAVRLVMHRPPPPIHVEVVAVPAAGSMSATGREML